jgi:hypothetical protein
MPKKCKRKRLNTLPEVAHKYFKNNGRFTFGLPQKYKNPFGFMKLKNKLMQVNIQKLNI